MSRRLKNSSFASICVFAALATATPSSAYNTGGAAWPPSVACGASCKSLPVTIRYSYINIFDGSIKQPDNTPLPNSLIKSSIEEALHVWTTAVDVNFVEVPYGANTDLGFRHIYINGPDPPPPADPIAKAQSTCIGFGAGCEVQYDDGDRWQLVGTQPVPDILGATIHEVGHVLGLNHSDDPTANMYWIFHRFTGLGTGQLFPDDIAGIQTIYGPGTGSVTPLAVPEPATALLLTLALISALPTRRRTPRR